ncbi:DUF5052 family protein [Paratissierella segnis]|jgi:hypothetical protein|uniref:DUF5052 family protein n=1 Tax=Paratissierella segnis TaxID=2763679 RepID=A0A926IIJ4_9FIRM|nr:DUF5052 family protein [Paratissierella segnis]MBC8587024.1 DUF5052 family protein [Paratissierella segnis]
MKRKSKLLIIFAIIVILASFSGCAKIKDFIAVKKGELIGGHYIINVYDNYANKTLTVDGKKITVGILENNDGDDSSSEGFDSSVLEITINGKQMIQVGNTVIFAEDGLDMIEDFDMPEEITIDNGGGFVPIDRFVNNIKNKIGKSKTIIISSQLGIPIGVYQGNSVYITVPKDLPKMTRLNIDGKSLYIHRANYVILDSNLL